MTGIPDCLAPDATAIICAMGMPAARLTDMVLQTQPHCHAPVHPPPLPFPHPPLPLPIVKGCPTVLVGKLPAARMTDLTKICTLPACVPAGPGIILKTSVTVFIGKMPAARLFDTTVHPTCVAPIPAPTGTILFPGCPTVLIG